MSEQVCLVDVDKLRNAIKDEYQEVATTPEKGFHFHTGRPLARMLDYKDEWMEGLPEDNIRSFAGVGNPFLLGELKPGQTVLDLGSGAGFDIMIAARMVGPTGRAIGVDMTPSMLEKARAGAKAAGLDNLTIKEGFLEELPVESASVDVVISNGVVNLCPNKTKVWREVARVLKPQGTVQLADIIVAKAVPEAAKQKVDLWTG